MAKNPNSVTMAEARRLAAAEMVKDHWVYVEEGAEWRHSDGRRGRLKFIPDFGAPIVKGRQDWVRAVELTPPGRKPTTEELMNRIPTIPASTPVITFWQD